MQRHGQSIVRKVSGDQRAYTLRISSAALGRPKEMKSRTPLIDSPLIVLGPIDPIEIDTKSQELCRPLDR